MKPPELSPMTCLAAFQIGDFVLAGFGAFFGALAAYWFERWKDRQEDADANHAAVLRAQMILICNVNSLAGLKRDFLDHYRDMPDRERQMALFYQMMNTDAVDVGSLSFFLDGSDPNLLLDLHLASKSYMNAADAIRIRNIEFERFAATADIHEFDLETGKLGGMVSLPRLKILKDATDSVFDCVDKALAKNERAVESLRQAAKPHFPKRKLLRFNLSNETPPDGNRQG